MLPARKGLLARGGPGESERAGKDSGTRARERVCRPLTLTSPPPLILQTRSCLHSESQPPSLISPREVSPIRPISGAIDHIAEFRLTRGGQLANVSTRSGFFENKTPRLSFSLKQKRKTKRKRFSKLCTFWQRPLGEERLALIYKWPIHPIAKSLSR